MATIYARSTDGNNADDGSTWALAKATLAGVAAIDAAGDVVYVSDNHAESTAGAISITWAGTLASPMKIICVDDAAEPPTATATTGVVETTGINAIVLNGVAYTYGLTFKAGSAGNSVNLTLANVDNSHLKFDSCVFHLSATVGTNVLSIGDQGTVGIESSVIFENCKVKFSNASQRILVRKANFRMIGGGLDSGTTAPSGLFSAMFAGGQILVDGCDLSYGTASMNIVASGAAMPGKVILRNCKLPSSWTGALLAGDPANAAFRAEMYNCTSGSTNYRLWIHDYAGKIFDETGSSAITRSGGASDGTNAMSWKMVSTNATYPTVVLETPEIVLWNDTTGSSKTATVEIITDNVTLKTSECWLEVSYYNTSGVLIGKWDSDAETNQITGIGGSSGNQDTSSVTWNNVPGGWTAVKQKLAVSFTPQEKGFIHARVMLAKGSTTVYVDPKITVT